MVCTILVSSLLTMGQSHKVYPSVDEALDGWIALWDGNPKDWLDNTDWVVTKSGNLQIGSKVNGPKAQVGVGKWKANLIAKSPETASLKAFWNQGGHSNLIGTWDPKTGPSFSFQSPPGKAGTLTLEGKDVELVSLWYQPTETRELIAGKGLEGWKLVPGKKSKVLVTPEGWIRIEDGPGDLQTSGQYGNFVAQLTLRTGGKHLNSGLFFRAIPGEQWQGYEAQIRNEFPPGPPRQFPVESFDPVTHQPTGKSMVTSPAVDWGTGAIYRRMPARSQGAQDREWFTLTVAAAGRTISTWVQGKPQVVWVDNRPENDNARQGYRSKPGVFGIQGHDPTTLIDFRSLKVLVLD